MTEDVAAEEFLKKMWKTKRENEMIIISAMRFNEKISLFIKCKTVASASCIHFPCHNNFRYTSKRQASENCCWEISENYENIFSRKIRHHHNSRWLFNLLAKLLSGCSFVYVRKWMYDTSRAIINRRQILWHVRECSIPANFSIEEWFGSWEMLLVENFLSDHHAKGNNVRESLRLILWHVTSHIHTGNLVLIYLVSFRMLIISRHENMTFLCRRLSFFFINSRKPIKLSCYILSECWLCCLILLSLP